MDGREVDFLVRNGRADVARDIQIEIVLFFDDLDGHPPRIAGFLLAELICVDDLVDMLFKQVILSLAFLEVFAGVDEQHVVRLFAFLEHQNAHRNAGGIEKVCWQSDHCIDVPVLEQLGADARQVECQLPRSRYASAPSIIRHARR